jgi:hypothetical protein
MPSSVKLTKKATDVDLGNLAVGLPSALAGRRSIPGHGRIEPDR